MNVRHAARRVVENSHNYPGCGFNRGGFGLQATRLPFIDEVQYRTWWSSWRPFRCRRGEKLDTFSRAVHLPSFGSFSNKITTLAINFSGILKLVAQRKAINQPNQSKSSIQNASSGRASRGGQKNQIEKLEFYH